MYLSEWNSAVDAAEWLTENTGEAWTWRNVLDMHSQTALPIVTVVNSLGTALTCLDADTVEVVMDAPLALQVDSAKEFLSHILMETDWAKARAVPSALIANNLRYRPHEPVHVSAIRLTKQQIHTLASLYVLYPFKKLVKEIKAGMHPDLERLVKDRMNPPVNDPAPMAPKAAATELRRPPRGGTSITPLVWDICYDLLEEEKKVTPKTVMPVLKELAKQGRYPLVGTVAGGVKYECENGDEKEFTNNRLQNSIEFWRTAIQNRASTSELPDNTGDI